MPTRIHVTEVDRIEFATAKVELGGPGIAEQIEDCPHRAVVKEWRRPSGADQRACLVAAIRQGKLVDAHAFKSGRCLSALIGLAPKQNSSGGKEKLGSTSKAGNRYLLQMHVLRQADCGDVDVGVG